MGEALGGLGALVESEACCIFDDGKILIKLIWFGWNLCGLVYGLDPNINTPACMIHLRMLISRDRLLKLNNLIELQEKLIEALG